MCNAAPCPPTAPRLLADEPGYRHILDATGAGPGYVIRQLRPLAERMVDAGLVEQAPRWQDAGFYEQTAAGLVEWLRLAEEDGDE